MENRPNIKDKKIRILRIIARLNIGGPAMQAVFLNKVFNTGPYESILIYGSIGKDEGDMAYLLGDNRASTICIKEMQREINVLRDAISFWKILCIMLRYRPHIVHTHTAKAGTLGRIAAIITSVPIKIHTLHGHVFNGYFSKPKTKIFKMIESFLAKFTDKIIILSPVLKEETREALDVKGEEKFSIIPLGIRADLFLKSDILKGGFKKELGVTDNTCLVGTIGRLVPIKNQKMFLDAASMVLKNNKSKNAIKFIITGDGELREELSLYAKEKNISDDVIFTGWRKDLNKVYADLDIVAISSLNEGTPVSLIEAMLAAKPVVATDVGGVRDLISHSETGYIVPKEDTEKFAACISELLNDSNKARAMGQAARRYAIEIYTEERLTKDIEILYRDLLKRKGFLI